MKKYGVLLKNDDKNTFADVILSLVKYANHGFIQAEQCALIVHNKGEYVIKSGDVIEMLETANQLKNCGLDAELIDL